MNNLPLSTTRLNLEFPIQDNRLRLGSFESLQRSWLNQDSSSRLFAALVDGQTYDLDNLSYGGFQQDQSAEGVQHIAITFTSPHFELIQHIQIYKDTALAEFWQNLRATSQQPITVSRLDSLSVDLPPSNYELLSFDSDWGQEFEPVRQPLTGTRILETRSGRSSKGQHPWFGLSAEDQKMLAGSIAWSGNWVIRFEPLPDGGYRLSAGMHDWEFTKQLALGESIESAHAILALGDHLDDLSQQFAHVGRRYWYPHSALASALPVEWNHWWAYEDVNITEARFLENVAAAAALGVEVCTLDAGWFGGKDWYQYRGDWDIITTERFPNGIRILADETRAKGMKFGIWCEIEGLGESAALAEKHPELVARRDGERCGYICLGSETAQDWAYGVLRHLIEDYHADWIKLDFNMDPKAGCNRTDHGHDSGDGLYAHYQGYYHVLQRIRADFPDVVLENCSSGGMRIDLSLMRHNHFVFLSDPDYPVHDLQIFWGATLMLAPNVCLHWSFNEWLEQHGVPQQTFDPHHPDLTQHQFDYYTRIGMLGAFGISQKLPDLPGWIHARLVHHIAVYKEHVRRFVREADLYRLTGQPRRNGEGDRWCAFQYALPDQSEHLLFVFRLPGAEPQRTLRLHGLQPNRLYQIQGFEGETRPPVTGQALMTEGLTFDQLQEEDSTLLRIF